MSPAIRKKLLSHSSWIGGAGVALMVIGVIAAIMAVGLNADALASGLARAAVFGLGVFLASGVFDWVVKELTD